MGRISLHNAKIELFNQVEPALSLDDGPALQHSTEPNNGGSIADAMLSIPGRAGPEKDIHETSHGFVQWVLEETRVAGPLPVK